MKSSPQETPSTKNKTKPTIRWSSPEPKNGKGYSMLKCFLVFPVRAIGKREDTWRILEAKKSLH
ncbi:hypothetical protein AKJ61_02135 [candidate division MSBL1 archaeon SCGC-AAA259B11]|uniref:Uncharacterized protein n=1 Tax=candidate division MSBL1 archaeon SCGC-AAA259B11 TaxID=1698260 RepID=A0A133U6H8_9EURY|nr:hypothetical protein AKJ61_02135 [candidate division MSBL1 archaeon SCGC-AAA259B11]